MLATVGLTVGIDSDVGTDFNVGIGCDVWGTIVFSDEVPAICDCDAVTTGCLFNPDMFFTGEFLSLSTSESENCTMTGGMIGAPGMGTNV